MKVLVYTSLFPNEKMPNFGIFIKQRMFHFSNLAEKSIKVVAPIPYCPKWITHEKWKKFQKITRSEKQNGIDVYHPRYPLLPKVSMAFHGILLFLGNLPQMKKIFRKFPFDIIDAHFVYPDGFAAILFGKIFKKPVIISARGSDINQYITFPLIKKLIKYTLNNATTIISVCQSLKNEMIQIGIPDKKIHVIPKGVDIHRFSLKDRVICRKRLHIRGKENAILSVGGLIERKGFHILIDAMKSISKENSNAHLYIIGEGPLRKELENRIMQHSLEKRVTLVGPIKNEELVNWYNSADVFCLASCREGWANVIMEALACGCPAIATNVYGAPEIITEEFLGRLVERTPDAFAKAINDFLAKSKNNRNRIRGHVFSRDWDVVAREVDNVFLSVVN